MATIKTVPSEASVKDFVGTLESKEQQQDCLTLIEMMSDISGEPPIMWGTNIIGFGQFTYTYASGRSGIWPKIAFAPRKGMLSLYITVIAENYKEELETIGKYKIGKGCIYIKRLADVDEAALKRLIQHAYKEGFFGDQAK